MATFMFPIASSSDAPCDQHPGRAGQPTAGATALKAVYWGTSDPKSLWTGSNRVTKDGAFSDALRLLDYRLGNTPANLGNQKGFRLVRRP